MEVNYCCCASRKCIIGSLLVRASTICLLYVGRCMTKSSLSTSKHRYNISVYALCSTCALQSTCVHRILACTSWIATHNNNVHFKEIGSRRFYWFEPILQSRAMSNKMYILDLNEKVSSMLHVDRVVLLASSKSNSLTSANCWCFGSK